MALNLDSVNARLTRAEEHLGVIGVELDAVFNGHPNTLVREVHANSTVWLYRIQFAHVPDYLKLSLAFGDCLHNLRCSLDYLTYAVAAYEHQGPGRFVAGRDFQFVISYSPDHYRKAAARRWVDGSGNPVLSANVRAAIEGVQPHNRPSPLGGRPTLALLRDLNNIDKHRLIPTPFSGHVMTTAEFPAEFAKLNPVLDYTEGHLEHNAEVARVTFSGPAPDVKHGFKFTLAIGVSDGGHGNYELYGFGRVLIDEVREVIRIVSAAVV